MSSKVTIGVVTRSQARMLNGVAQSFRVTKRKADAKTPTKDVATKRVKTASRPMVSLNLQPADAPVAVGAEELKIVPAAVAEKTAAIGLPRKSLDYDEVIAHLTRQDPALGNIIKTSTKKCSIFVDSEHEASDSKQLDAFKALCTAIVYQQLSGKAASAILKKWLLLFGITSEKVNDKDTTSEKKPKVFPTPQEVRSIDVQTYRDAGLSYRKAEYLHSLADKFIDGSISSEALLSMDDEEISALLCSVKGIGQWTVDMFLMFDLKRPNILPVGDLGVRKGMSQHFQMRAGNSKRKKTKSSGTVDKGVYLPTPEEMIDAARIWEPYRTVGSYYMWALLDIKTVEKEK